VPAATQTFAGILEMTTRLRAEMGLVDRVMHEVNGKVMRSPASLPLKRSWLDVYDRWNALALNHPLITSAEPRIPLPEISTTAARVGALKAEGLSLYARWKADMMAMGIPTTPQQAQQAQASAMGGPAPTVTQQAENQGPGALKVCLYGAALLGGAAAISTIWAAWRKPAQPVYPVLPPNMLPAPTIPSLSPLASTPVVLPTIPALMPMGGTMAFSIPPDGHGDVEEIGDEL
jgi:hypothetical protein